MIKLIITDADDTLYPWVEPYIGNFVQALKEVSKMASVPFRDVLKMAGEINREIGEIENAYATLDELGNRLGLCHPLTALVGYRFEGRFHQAVREGAAARNFLRTARLLDIPVCVVSESRIGPLQNKLGESGMQMLVDKVVCRSDADEDSCGYTCRRFVKPNTDILLEICEEFKVKPEEVLYVGDSETKDMLAAIECGMQPALCKVFERGTAEEALYALSHWSDDEICANQTLLKKWQGVDQEKVFAFTDYEALQQRLIGIVKAPTILEKQKALRNPM